MKFFNQKRAESGRNPGEHSKRKSEKSERRRIGRKARLNFNQKFLFKESTKDARETWRSSERKSKKSKKIKTAARAKRPHRYRCPPTSRHRRQSALQGASRRTHRRLPREPAAPATRLATRRPWLRPAGARPFPRPRAAPI